MNLIRVSALSTAVLLVLGVGALYSGPGFARQATASSLDALLATCPYPDATEIPQVEVFFAEWGLGGPPVWLDMWGNIPDALRDRYPGEDEPYVGLHFVATEHGWGMRALWVIQPGWDLPASVHGSRVGDGAPVLFNVLNSRPATVLTLDPAQPAIPIQHGGWAEFPGSAFFPATGCYEVVAEWEGGSWRVRIPFVAPDGVATPVA